ncbi:hypothetical protein, partial [Gracilibacillus halotolerans]
YKIWGGASFFMFLSPCHTRAGNYEIHSNKYIFFKKAKSWTKFNFKSPKTNNKMLFYKLRSQTRDSCRKSNS